MQVKVCLVNARTRDIDDVPEAELQSRICAAVRRFAADGLSLGDMLRTVSGSLCTELTHYFLVERPQRVQIIVQPTVVRALVFVFTSSVAASGGGADLVGALPVGRCRCWSVCCAARRWRRGARRRLR